MTFNALLSEIVPIQNGTVALRVENWTGIINAGDTIVLGSHELLIRSIEDFISQLDRNKIRRGENPSLGLVVSISQSTELDRYIGDIITGKE